MKASLLVLGLFQIAFNVSGVNSRCLYPRIKNGYLRKKPGNRIAFFCVSGYSRYGSRISECEGSKWNSPPPICVAPGCPSVPTNPRRDMDFSHNEAVVIFTCLDTFVLVGKATAYCDGKVWSSPAPECQNPGDIEKCDFEDGEWCGWEQDQTDDFDWSRHSGQTTTGRTGPDFDHTLGPTRLDGHYIYMESSVPRSLGHVARLLSPVYPPSKSGRCFRFWYHMKGPGGENLVGSLAISLRLLNGDQTATDDVLFTVKENQGPDWKEGEVFIYKTDTPFRIVMAATRQQSYISDIAVDDISLYDCQGVVTTMKQSSTEMTSQTTEMETTELATVGETTELFASRQTTLETGLKETSAYHMTTEMSAPGQATKITGRDVTSAYPQSTPPVPLSTMISSSTAMYTSSNTAPDVNTGRDVNDVSTPLSSSVSVTEYFDEISMSSYDQSTTDLSEIGATLILTTVGEVISKEDITKQDYNKTMFDTHAYKNMSKSGVKKPVFQNEGVIHTASFAVSITVGIAVIVIGALVIAFIVHRMKKQTKHYKDDDFETMHTATYRKQSTDGLII
ncbi:MAM and LDL-receptor class A domain-containing protein 2-like [Pecten maximus]|uniref:MAM and LDL-receptor class A domain-containing protein 2-like n=1 Tax=Pecten maximus TaxID=6579 RepID=UPI001458E370|nr:MAM and LDL-receptor class A domain-containing protein 2-like [Pecten maximus]